MSDCIHCDKGVARGADGWHKHLYSDGYILCPLWKRPTPEAKTSNLVAELRKALREPVIRGSHHVLMREAADVLERLQSNAPETKATLDITLPREEAALLDQFMPGPPETSCKPAGYSEEAFAGGEPLYTRHAPEDDREPIAEGDARYYSPPKAEAQPETTANELLEIARIVATMDCFYSGATHEPDCKCLVGRAERAINPNSAEKTTTPLTTDPARIDAEQFPEDRS